jgi:hypothetical protein
MAACALSSNDMPIKPAMMTIFFNQPISFKVTKFSLEEFEKTVKTGQITPI